jgi:predicted AlkP superfamily pyrophosphatase or phosphodiesterase
MRPFLVVVACSCLISLIVACAPRYVRSQSSDPGLHQPVVSLTRNVLIVSIDGLRPDAIREYAAPTLQRLMQEGSYSLSARTIMPSSTLPSHTSMLSGEPPEEHGVLWNNVVSARADVVGFPTVFSVAREHGYSTAAFFSKAKFGPLQRPGTLDYSQAPGGWFGRWSSDRTVADVRSYLAQNRPNLLFVHLADPDRAGHSSGWMSDAYGRAVRSADSAVAALLQSADAAYGVGNYSLLVTADHGGHANGHGTSDPRDVTIPWIAWGRGVRAGELKDVAINTFDTAPTVLWLLGVEEPAAWDGVPVRAAWGTD